MRLAVITAILASLALVAAPAALADGDPASDVLVDKAYFQPSDLPLPAATVSELQGVLAASARAGFPIRVALIASESDLGTATALWRDPRDYARYLWFELSELYGGQVLVVMPNGFGLYGKRSGLHGVTRGELSVRATAPGPGAQLAAAALSAVPLLARASGHPIPAAKLAAAERSATRATNAPSAGALPSSALVALAAGVLLIALAWMLSLRARPLTLRRGLRS